MGPITQTLAATFLAVLTPAEANHPSTHFCDVFSQKGLVMRDNNGSAYMRFAGELVFFDKNPVLAMREYHSRDFDIVISIVGDRVEGENGEYAMPVTIRLGDRDNSVRYTGLNMRCS